jgi:predicted ferric reductase
MARQARRQGARPPAQAASAIVTTLRSLKPAAEAIGEWTFYAVVLLIALALVKRFPYRWFQKTHRLLAIALGLFVFHAVVLMKITYWTLPVGPVMALLWLAALVASVIVLARRVGAGRRASAEVIAVEALPESESVAVTVRVDARWKGHAAGQFAFVSFASAPEPHPFTMASAWSESRELRFVIKALGDHTKATVARVKAGDRATIEGPYGRFNFASEKPRQLWIAGGIGVTPFLARLKALASEKQARAIDLFFCAKAADRSLLDELRSGAEAAGVRLHVLIEPKDGRLDAERIAATVPEWKQGDLWFCGPEAFGASLRKALTKRGLASDDFHSELFAMR